MKTVCGEKVKGRKETRAKKEKKTTGRKIPRGIVRDPPGGKREE